ncbi:hypothetical protein [uncultured Duncaniella sp.]|uniref:hypothetical protein n=1 Tax=uncultured Duncaniella sp. TaxID=2768039 RepID=UPI002601A3A6|nr:hypothetical protein [uncultured Duncaniella sp.]
MADYINAAVALNENLPLLLMCRLLAGAAPFVLWDFHLYAERSLATAGEQEYEVGNTFDLTLINHHCASLGSSPTTIRNGKQKIADLGEGLPEPTDANMLNLAL